MSQRIIIPSGSIPEGETSVIEIPSQYQASNILIASPLLHGASATPYGRPVRARRRRLDFSADSDLQDSFRSCLSAPGSPLPGVSIHDDSSSPGADISVRSAPSPQRRQPPPKPPRRNLPQPPSAQEPLPGPSQPQRSQPPPKPPRRFLPRPIGPPPSRPPPPIPQTSQPGQAQVQSTTVPPPLPPRLYPPIPPPRIEMHDYDRFAQNVLYHKFSQRLPAQRPPPSDEADVLDRLHMEWRAMKFKNLLDSSTWSEMDGYLYDMEKHKFEYDKQKYQKCRKNFMYNVSKVTCDAFKTVLSKKYRKKKKAEKIKKNFPQMNLPHSTPSRQ